MKLSNFKTSAPLNLQSLSSEERSKNLFSQISSGFFIKGLLLLITYAQFPVFNKFLNKEDFGLWMTFISFYNWFILFDFGIGHGLKNILSEKLALEDQVTLKKYSSSGIAGTVLITLAFILIFEIIGPFVLSENLFKTSANLFKLGTALRFTFYSCIILFLHNTLGSMMHSVQRSSYTSYLSLLVNTLLLIIALLFVLNNSTSFNKSLETLSGINFILYSLIFFLICILFFTKYPVFIPDFTQVSWKYLSEVLTKGSKFFFIQISILVVFPIDSFILANSVSATATGDYNVIIKIYSLILVAATIINQSSWPSITEAYYKKDDAWLKELFQKFIFINSALIAFIILLSFYLNDLISLWMRENYQFSQKTIWLTAFLHIFFLISTVLSTILYSTNFLRSQIVIGAILILVKLFLIYYLAIQNSLNMEGVLLSSFICFLLLSIFNGLLFFQKFRKI